MDRADTLFPPGAGTAEASEPVFTTRDRLLLRLLEVAGRARSHQGLGEGERPATTRERLVEEFTRARPPVDLSPEITIVDDAPIDPMVEKAALAWLDRNGRFLVAIATSLANLVVNLRRNLPSVRALDEGRVRSLLARWADGRAVRLPA
jgi:hypothetical protein